MSKQRLVVVGNGMAGARTVEEILARGGRQQFEIVMFGDEPYGNYNRILLSNVVNGSQDPSEIFLNSLPWYDENGIKLYAGERVTRIERASKQVFTESGVCERYDKLILATGSSALVPPIKNTQDEHGKLRPSVFASRTLDDCHQIVTAATTSKKA